MSSTECSRFAAIVRGNICGLFLLALFSQSATQSFAGLFTLVDGNSEVDFDTSSSSNAYNWTVDGQDQLFQQAFWYRVGNVAAEQSLHSLPHPVEGVSDADFDGDPDTLFVRYQGAGFEVEVRYSLDGGVADSGVSDMGEQIKITNNSGAPLDFHFFQYSDFEIMGTPANDTAVFVNANTVLQTEGLISLSETVATPAASHREINFFATTRNKLEDGVATTLNDLPLIGVPLGPGDMTWAFQWDRVIPASGAGRSFLISKDKRLSVIPEPGTIAMLAIAGLLLGLTRGRDRLFC